MATRVLHGIKFFEQFLKLTTKGTFLWTLDEIGLAVYEDMSFKVKFYWWTDVRRKAITKAHHVTIRQVSWKYKNNTKEKYSELNWKSIFIKYNFQTKLTYKDLNKI
jgi:hypothetical protein